MNVNFVEKFLYVINNFGEKVYKENTCFILPYNTTLMGVLALYKDIVLKVFKIEFVAV